MQAMKGATGVLGSMNRNMNLPALQRITMEFERENDMMDQRQEMMDDAIDDVTGLEDEAEGDEVVERVLEEIGVDLKAAVSFLPRTSKSFLTCGDSWVRHPPVWKRQPLPRAESRRLSVAVVQIQSMMICRLVLTA